MLFNISAGLFFIFTALDSFGITTIPAWAVGVAALGAAIALFIGLGAAPAGERRWWM